MERVKKNSQVNFVRKGILQFTECKVNELKLYDYNARIHNDEQVSEIAKSINRFGFINPILIDPNKVIIAGHGRFLAAKLLKLDSVPCVAISGLSQLQVRALRLADNKIAANAGWNFMLLRNELKALEEIDKDSIFDLGFNKDEITDLFEDDVSDGKSGKNVREVGIGTVEDRFWISVRGPLRDQAHALKHLQQLMKFSTEIEVELGTTAIGL